MTKLQKPKSIINPPNNGSVTKKSSNKSIKKLKPKKKDTKLQRKGSESQEADIKKNVAAAPLDTRNLRDGVRVFFEMYAKQKEIRNNKNLLDDSDEPIFLQIIGIKIPRCHDHKVRIDLPHPNHPKDAEICLITADLPKTNLRDYDKVTEHYEDILKAEDVTNIKTIMSYHQLRNEYQEFEMKRKLASAYNVFLADSKIQGRVVHFLGNTFDKLHKIPRVVTFGKRNFKAQVDRILSQTDLKVHNKGNTVGIQVGLVGMKAGDVLANVKAVATKLPFIYPGGSENIRSISIKTTNSMALPLYLTLKMKSEVDIPKLVPPNARKRIIYTGELSTRLNTKVAVSPGGHVRTILIKKPQKQRVDTKRITRRATAIPRTAKSEENDEKGKNHSVSADKKNFVDALQTPRIKTQNTSKTLSNLSKEIVKEKKDKTSPVDKKRSTNLPDNSILKRSEEKPKKKGAIKTATPPKRAFLPRLAQNSPKTLQNKRKSMSAHTGNQKKTKLIKNPFYNANTTR